MDDAPRRAERKSVGLLVKLNHPDLGNFVEGFATNISATGMFIRSRKPHPVGTDVRFQIEIANGLRVMKGTAVVRWAREAGDPTGAAGMGLQFKDVDADTQALIDKMLASAGAGSAVEPKIEPAPKAGKPTAASPRPAAAKAAPASPGPAAAKTSVASIVPPIAAVAPAVAPVPSAPPKSAAAARPAAPAARAAPASAAPDLGALFDGELEIESTEAQPLEISDARAPAERKPAAPQKPALVAPPAAAKPAPAPPPELELNLEPGLGDEPLSFGAPAPAGPDIPPPPAEDVNISIDDLVRGTPAPTKGAAAAPPLELDVEFGGSEGGEEVLEGVEVQLETDGTHAPSEGEIELELDLEAEAAMLDAEPETEEPLELDLDRAPKSVVRAQSNKPQPRAPAKPAPAPAAKAAPPPAAKAAPPPAPTASGATAVGKMSPSLPNIRREGPAAPAPAPAKPVLLDAPKPAVPSAPMASTGPVFLQPPASIAGTGPVIGIDLGTTNSCVALLNGTKPVVLRSKEGYNTLPSVVSLSNTKKLLVSHRAKSQMVLNPHQTIYGAKRLVGRMYDSATVRQVRERFHYEILADTNGKAAVKLGEHVLTLEEVQGLILRECKEMAEQHLNQKVERAVITVPAYYSEPQREAVRKSGAMAGLKVERILNEPTAAALAYGLNRELKKRVLVYDLGGGTFDATLLRIDKNVFEVLATGGDIFLGGLDFDAQIVDFLLQRFQETEKISFSGDSVALSRVTDAAERLKIALSERTSFEVHIPMLMMDDSGKPRDLRCTVKREELDEICAPLVNRTLDVVRDVLLDAKLKPSDVEEIILVGGQSRMPYVREKIKALFGKPPHASVNADEAVALGAALYSGSVDKVSSVVLIDVLPMTIGVAMPGGAFKRVIERNTALPVQRSFGLATSKDNETVLELSLFQGEDALVSSNEYLGTVRVEDLPKGPKGAVKLAVTLKVDSECVLHVEASELSTRKQVRATIATRYTPQALNQKLNISDTAIQAAEAKRSEELKERGGKFWGFLKKVLKR